MDRDRPARVSFDSLWDNKLRILGSGSYGDVALVSWNGTPAALKRAKSSLDYEALEDEKKILSALKGKGGAPRLLRSFTDPPAIVMEFKGDKSLSDVQNNRSDALDIIYKIGCRLQEIHEAHFVHNDLKENNIMIEGLNSDPKISIIDYGLACRPGIKIGMTGEPSEYPWYAPEVFKDLPSTYATDVFSFGVLIENLLNSQNKLLSLVNNNPKLSKVIRASVHPNPKKRPRLPDLLSHVEVLLKPAVELATSVRPPKRKLIMSPEHPCNNTRENERPRYNFRRK
nr:probable serine/threonine-protein kinase gdt4 [Cherax quadricarinatus]